MCSTVRACLSAAVPVYDGQGYAARLAISCFHSYKYTSVIVSTRTQFRVYIYIYHIFMWSKYLYSPDVPSRTQRRYCKYFVLRSTGYWHSRVLRRNDNK